MEINLEKKDINNASLKVSIVEKDYEEKVNEKLRDYSKKANIKGFRPGKVPLGVVKQMVGKNLIADEVYTLLTENINSYIKENDIAIIGDPLPSEDDKRLDIDWGNQKEYSFTYDLGLIPEFSYDVSSKVKVQSYKIEIDDKANQEASDNLQKQYGDMQKPEEVSEDDFISGDLVSEDESFNKFTILPLSKISTKSLKKFIGAKVGDKVTFDIRKAFKKEISHIAYATGMTKEDAEKAKGDYTITITEISRSKKAQLNQEFLIKYSALESSKPRKNMMLNSKKS